MRPPTVRNALRAAVAGAMVVASCGGCTAGGRTVGDEGRPWVIVTTGIWGDVVAEIVDDCATIDVLIPEGVDPHGFEPSARQAASLRDADLVVANGIGLERQLEPVLDTAEHDGARIFAVGDHLDPVLFEASGGRRGEDQGDEDDADEDQGDEDDADDQDGDDQHDGRHRPDEADPHVWQDPRRVARAAPLLAQELARATDCDPVRLHQRAEAYAAAVSRTDEAIAAELATVPDDRRRLVTNHDSFAYFADRYGFELLGSVIPSRTTLAEPGSAELAALADLIAAAGVPAVFTETTGSPRLAEALVEETGRPVEVVELYSDSLGEPGSGADTYLGMIRTNADRVADALR